MGWEDPLEKGKATHSNILAWRIPWTVYMYSPWGDKELDTAEQLSLSLLSVEKRLFPGVNEGPCFPVTVIPSGQ